MYDKQNQYFINNKFWNFFIFVEVLKETNQKNQMLLML